MLPGVTDPKAKPSLVEITVCGSVFTETLVLLKLTDQRQKLLDMRDYGVVDPHGGPFRGMILGRDGNIILHGRDGNIGMRMYVSFEKWMGGVGDPNVSRSMSYPLVILLLPIPNPILLFG